MNKIKSLKQLDPHIPELEWEMAVDALSQNGMDVNETFYMLQTEWLQPLYEFIFSEFTAVTKTDNENIKKIIKSKDDNFYSAEVWTSDQARLVKKTTSCLVATCRLVVAM